MPPVYLTAPLSPPPTVGTCLSKVRERAWEMNATKVQGLPH